METSAQEHKARMHQHCQKTQLNAGCGPDGDEDDCSDDGQAVQAPAPHAASNQYSRPDCGRIVEQSVVERAVQVGGKSNISKRPATATADQKEQQPAPTTAATTAAATASPV
eukprot:2852076-Amphidinium_carterae.1